MTAISFMGSYNRWMARKVAFICFKLEKKKRKYLNKYILDPRNLMICFECLRLMCQELKLGPFVEETFEIFACYFPIDFTPVKIKLI